MEGSRERGGKRTRERRSSSSWGAMTETARCEGEGHGPWAWVAMALGIMVA